mmetsp:Transcript_30417/g.79744  ORF Transcript_30417/g.79744 Transcript_30417/m.79744 type:complete len:206 (-) Transcript_30417:45-662(-)
MGRIVVKLLLHRGEDSVLGSVLGLFSGLAHACHRVESRVVGEDAVNQPGLPARRLVEGHRQPPLPGGINRQINPRGRHRHSCISLEKPLGVLCQRGIRCVATDAGLDHRPVKDHLDGRIDRLELLRCPHDPFLGQHALPLPRALFEGDHAIVLGEEGGLGVREQGVSKVSPPEVGRGGPAMLPSLEWGGTCRQRQRPHDCYRHGR